MTGSPLNLIMIYVAEQVTPNFISFYSYNRRDDRAVEGARLESVCTGNRTEGSNPSLSATLKQTACAVFFITGLFVKL